MFGLFKSPRFTDPALGVLTRERGAWRGSVHVPGGGDVPVVLPGGREAPDAAALAAAARVPADYAAWKPLIAEALLEHARPYFETLAQDDDAVDSEPPPVQPSTPHEVWLQVALQYLAVMPLDGLLTVELGYAAAWDDDHLLGARLRDGRLVELNGSVVAP